MNKNPKMMSYMEVTMGEKRWEIMMKRIANMSHNELADFRFGFICGSELARESDAKRFLEIKNFLDEKLGSGTQRAQHGDDNANAN